MPNPRALRLAPAREGRRLALTWRFWRQGDEFYAAARDAAVLTKVSFHRNGNWQAQVGPTVRRLTPHRRVNDDWLHVVSIYWLLPPESYIPLASTKEAATLVEVPSGSKLIVNLLLTLRGDKPALPPLPPGSLLPWVQDLRGGRTLVVHAVTEPEVDLDRDTVRRIRKEAGPLRVKEVPPAGEFYGEITWFALRPEANCLVIVPLGPDINPLVAT
jgi:hypothetical protein